MTDFENKGAPTLTSIRQRLTADEWRFVEPLLGAYGEAWVVENWSRLERQLDYVRTPLTMTDKGALNIEMIRQRLSPDEWLLIEPILADRGEAWVVANWPMLESQLHYGVL